MKRCLLAIILLMHSAVSQTVSRTVEVVVERAKADDWEAVDARTVFMPDEQIRFRLRSSFSGFLYVLDETSTGQYVWLFPDKNAGLDNQIQAGQWSLVPATRGAFGIPKQAGFETIYWIISPTPLRDLNAEAVRGARAPLPTMTPRCDEPVLKARGTCLDQTAGLKAVSDSARMQEAIGSKSVLQSRNLAFNRTLQSNIVKAKNATEDALVYEFRIAHR